MASLRESERGPRRYGQRRDGIRGERDYKERDYKERDREGRGYDVWDRDGRDRYAAERSRHRERDTRRYPDSKYRDERSRGDREQTQRDERARDRDRDETRSKSPRPHKRTRLASRSPELENVEPIDQRVRKRTYWDTRPPGYEYVSSDLAKASGLFPAPGVPRPLDYERLDQAINDPDGPNGLNGVILYPDDVRPLQPSASRIARRVRVLGLDLSCHPLKNVVDVFEDLFASLLLETRSYRPGARPFENNVVASFTKQSSVDQVDKKEDIINNDMKEHIMHDIILQFRTAEQATIAVAYDDTLLDASGRVPRLKIRRPSEYMEPELVRSPVRIEEGKPYTDSVVETQNKITIANIPLYLDESQIVELASAFGQLHAFRFLRDEETLEPKGVAFCEYRDPSVTPIAVQALDKMQLGENALRVRRSAESGRLQARSIMRAPLDKLGLAANDADRHPKTTVIQLFNMVEAEELVDDEEYQDLLQEISRECSKLGDVAAVKIPRPTTEYMETGLRVAEPGVGRVFVKFNTLDSSKLGVKWLAGRKFSDRTIVTTFYNEQSFDFDAF